MENELSSLLPSLKLLPFDNPNILSYNEALIECPKCKAVDDFYSRRKTRRFESYYCPGNQPAEIEHSDMFGGKHKHPIVCAGLDLEHFHTQCRACGFTFLMALPVQEPENE